MGDRLTKITTRSGDDGSTGLADGQRLPKSHPRIAVLGEVDELNSWLGLVLAEELPRDVASVLLELQQSLFDLGAELSLPEARMIGPRHIEAVEAATRRFNRDLPPLAEFVLPGGGRVAALSHLARAVCRRAERSLIVLGEREAVSEAARQLLNRASDLLFVLARVCARGAGWEEVTWRGPASRG